MWTSVSRTDAKLLPRSRVSWSGVSRAAALRVRALAQRLYAKRKIRSACVMADHECSTRLAVVSARTVAGRCVSRLAGGGRLPGGERAGGGRVPASGVPDLAARRAAPVRRGARRLVGRVDVARSARRARGRRRRVLLA